MFLSSTCLLLFLLQINSHKAKQKQQLHSALGCVCHSLPTTLAVVSDSLHCHSLGGHYNVLLSATLIFISYVLFISLSVLSFQIVYPNSHLMLSRPFPRPYQLHPSSFSLMVLSFFFLDAQISASFVAIRLLRLCAKTINTGYFWFKPLHCIRFFFHYTLIILRLFFDFDSISIYEWIRPVSNALY